MCSGQDRVATSSTSRACDSGPQADPPHIDVVGHHLKGFGEDEATRRIDLPINAPGNGPAVADQLSLV